MEDLLWQYFQWNLRDTKKYLPESPAGTPTSPSQTPDMKLFSRWKFMFGGA